VNSKNGVSNEVRCIVPYLFGTEWVFDDPSAGLDKEPFVNGADILIDRLVENLPNAGFGFRLLFSDKPYEGYTVKLIWNSEEADGNWYYCEKFDDYGWLCPALLRYFKDAPAEIYVSAVALMDPHSRAAKIADCLKKHPLLN
jgi:hypothetical protein